MAASDEIRAAQQAGYRQALDRALQAASLDSTADDEMSRLAALAKGGLLVDPKLGDIYARLMSRPASVAPSERQQLVNFQVELARGAEGWLPPTLDLPEPALLAGVEVKPGGVVFHIGWDPAGVPSADVVRNQPTAPVTDLTAPVDVPHAMSTIGSSDGVPVHATTAQRAHLRGLRPLLNAAGAVRYSPVTPRSVDDVGALRSSLGGHGSAQVHSVDATTLPALTPGNVLQVDVPGSDQQKTQEIIKALGEAGVPVDQATPTAPFLHHPTPDAPGQPHVGVSVPLGDQADGKTVGAAWKAAHDLKAQHEGLKMAMHLHGAPAPSGSKQVWDHLHSDAAGRTLVARSGTASVDAMNAVPVHVPADEADSLPTTDHRVLADYRGPGDGNVGSPDPNGNVVLNGEMQVLTTHLDQKVQVSAKNVLNAQLADGTRMTFAAVVPGPVGPRKLPALAYGASEAEATQALQALGVTPDQVVVVEIDGSRTHPKIVVHPPSSPTGPDLGGAVEAVRLLRRSGVSVPDVRKVIAPAGVSATPPMMG